jgi:hypothetical protein
MKRLMFLLGWSLVPGLVLCSSAWDDFLGQPDAKSAAVLAARLTGSFCASATTPNSRQVGVLVKLLEKRDAAIAVIRPAYLVAHCLDGGDLEDVYRALGSALARHPKNVLRALSQEDVPDTRLRYLATTLPLTLVDNLDGQVAEIDRRIARTRSATEPATAALSRRILVVLAERRNALASIRGQVGTR